MGRIHWGRLLRRALAVCMAAVALWFLCLGAGTGALSGAVRALGTSEAFVTAALRAELGGVEEPLPPFLRLIVGQSPLLAANGGEISATPQPTGEPLPDAQPVPDRDDMGTEPPQAVAPENIVERTLVPDSSEGYLTAGGLYLYNRTEHQVDLAQALESPLELTLAPAPEGPQILIIHTHATEAYTPDGEDTYIPSDNSRTVDQTQNMLRVGDEMEGVFTSMGLSVLHDRGLYDYPKYNGAYGRSGEAVARYLEEYPTIKVVLDVHRDALEGSDGTVYKAVTTVDSVKTAQIMVVMGSDTGDGVHPRWRENLALGLKVQKSLDTLFPTLARPMALRNAVYNQNLSVGSFLVEVGTHGNTLQEALAGARDFARSAGAVFLGLVEEN